MLINYQFSLNIFIEYLFIQIILFLTLVNIINVDSNVKKLILFLIMVFFIGIFISLKGYSLLISFLWLIELSFITIFIILLINDNFLLKKLYKINVKNKETFYFILLFMIYICLPLYVYFSKERIEITPYSPLYFIKPNLLNNFYLNNNNSTIILSDLKGIGFSLFNTNSLLLISFFTLLFLVTVFVIFVQIESFLKKYNHKKNISKKILFTIKSNINKGFMKREVLDLQLNKRPVLRYTKKYIKNNITNTLEDKDLKKETEKKIKNLVDDLKKKRKNA